MLVLTITATTEKDIEDLACALRSIVDLIGVDWRSGSFQNPTSSVNFKIEGDELPTPRKDEEEF